MRTQPKLTAIILLNIKQPTAFLDAMGTPSFHCWVQTDGSQRHPPFVVCPSEQKELRRCGGTHFDIMCPNLKLGAKIAFPISDGVSLSDLEINVGKDGFPPFRVVSKRVPSLSQIRTANRRLRQRLLSLQVRLVF